MKEKFIMFVKANPDLIDYVKNNNISWQSLYEVYSLYGEDKEVWDKYKKSDTKSLEELIKMIKGINLESIKNVVESLQKAISILQGFNLDKKEEQYETRNKYEDLDD